MPKSAKVKKAVPTSAVAKPAATPGPNGLPRKKTRAKRAANPTPRPARERLLQLQKRFEPRPRPERKPRKRPYQPRCYHKMTEREVKEIVLARYGSLTDFSHWHATIASIARRFRRPNMTVQYAIQKWQQRGCFEDRREQNGQHVQFKVVQHKLKDLLLDQQTLQAWSGFTLADRCAILRQHNNVDIRWWALRYFYQKHGVRLLATNYIYQ
jgi:transposase